MARLFSHPFRVDQNSRVVTVDQDSDAYLAERISLIVQTRPGERVMAPEFGIDDPAFDGLHQPALDLQLDMFELPAVIDRIAEHPVTDGKTEYTIEFHRDESNDEDDFEDD